MNIGIDFNTKTTKAAVLVGGSNVDDYNIFDIKNVLVFYNGGIFAGDDGFNKFLAEKDSVIYELDQIIEWNGLIINKKQISAEKCLSIIFSHLLNKIQTHTQNNEIGFICISIPYDKYYYWHGLMKKAFSLIGVQEIRIISQPAAFFAQININQRYKKFLSEKPEYRGESESTGNLFASISQDNINVSLVIYGEDVLEIVSTQYTNSITRRKIENIVLDYFVSQISKDSRNFALKEQKTLLRILEVVNEILRTLQSGNTFELNLPYVLCENGEYKTLNTKIDLDALRFFLAPTFNDLVETIKQLALKTQAAQKEHKYQTKIGNIIVIGDLFIQQNIKEILPKVFVGSDVALGTEKSLAIGAFNFSRVMTGENRDFLALEVIPFSVLLRLRGGEFVEFIKKDTTIPTKSKEHCFQIEGKGKLKFAEVHLITKEGDSSQSLNVWKIKIDDLKSFRVQVDIEVNLEISLKAYAHDATQPYYESESTLRILRGEKPPGEQLVAQSGSTFSFSGTGFEVGIKGKDIRQYILNQFIYLSVVLENTEVAIFEPDEYFYSMLRDGDPFKALRYLGHFLKLKKLPDVEMAESRFFEEQGIGGFISDSKISIPKFFINDPYGFGYVLAHELAHYILIQEEGILLDDEQENEILTEMFIIYKGLGKLFLNGFQTKDVKDSSLHTHGYLNENITKYIHQIYFSKFNVNLHEYRNNLTKEAMKMLDELVRK